MEPKNYGRTVTGALITEEFIEKANREAEAGWDVDELLRWRDVGPGFEPDPDSHARSAPPRRSRRQK
ncbi:MAG TPA: hypothetical protein VFS64_06695 [Solirubrobacterales bacterium]|nr:hypothetical protein [Solirubrobacterales bacterium]